MNFIEASIFILFIAIISVPLATRFRLPLEIFLVIGSCLISLIPGLPSMQINSMIVFNLFLPPILFYAAYFTSWHEFKFNFRAISLLAFGLVIVTTISVAFVAKWLLPEATWAECFLLGAIVSPTDASAATAIIKKLGAPRRLITVLEGESLVNDATALLLFRFSLAAVLSGSFSLNMAIVNFFFVTIGGALIGICIGLAAVFVLRRLHDVRAETTFTFIIAFTCYLLAERIGVSGVISTVVCGIFFGKQLPELAPSQTRLNAKASWNTLIFIINGFVFTLIGLELPWVVKNLGTQAISQLIIYGAIISAVVILVRLLWVFPAAHFPRLLIPSIKRKDPTPPWQSLFILGWCGMRGIISLAAALALPQMISQGVLFPHRDALVFITYCVIVATLLIPSLTLPFFLRFFHLSESENKAKEEAIARIRSLEGVMERITSLVEKESIPCELFDEFKKQVERRLKVINTQLERAPYSTLTNEYTSIKKLTMLALQSERETLIRLRKSGEIHEDVFHLLSDELDLEEIRTKSLRL